MEMPVTTGSIDAFAQEKNLYGITLEVRVSNNAAIALYEKKKNNNGNACHYWKYFHIIKASSFGLL